MKRKTISVISVCAALALGSSVFVACDNGDKRPTPPAPEPAPTVLTPAQKLERGIKLLAEKPARSSVISATLSSDGKAAATYEYTFVENGTAAKASDGASEYFIDLDTGYGYGVSENGATYEQVFPAKLYGYTAEAIKNELPEKIGNGEPDEYLSEADGAVWIAIDIKDDVNNKLEMLSACYDGSLRDVLAELLAGESTPEEFFDGISDMILLNADKNATYMISMINTQLANLDIDLTVKDIFIGAGVTEEEYSAVSSRKVSEMAAGAITLKDTLADMFADGNFENVDYAALVRTAFDAMFKSEISQDRLDSLASDLALVKSDILSFLSSYKVKSLVDIIVERTGMEDVRTMIAEAVSFTRLDAQIAVEFDPDGCISGISYSATVAHDRAAAVGTAADNETELPSAKFSLLSDNNYSAVGKITFGTPESTEIALPDNTLPLGETVVVSAVAGTNGAEIYIECGANETLTAEITGVTLDGSDKTFDTSACALVGKTLKIEKSVIDAARPQSGAACLRVEGTVNGKPFAAMVYVPADYSLDSLIECMRGSIV